jgi:hypothetical protein
MQNIFVNGDRRVEAKANKCLVGSRDELAEIFFSLSFEDQLFV